MQRYSVSARRVDDGVRLELTRGVHGHSVQGSLEEVHKYYRVFQVDPKKFDFDVNFICGYFIYKLQITKSVAFFLALHSVLTFMGKIQEWKKLLVG